MNFQFFKFTFKMWVIFFVSLLYAAIELEATESKQIRIPIMRQKTPREQAAIAPNLKSFGIDFEWLHKPHKHNRTNDSIAIFRYLDNEFYGIVQIGQKGQKFNMMFDTTWGTSWVISSDCISTTVGCISHNKYDHSKSFTYVPDGTPFNVDAGTYNLTGYYSNDTILIGHTRVYGQLFVEMTYVPPEYALYKSDGVMGLGWQLGKYEPFFYNMIRNKSIENPLFSIYLNRDRQSNRGGNILLGFIDEKHIHQKPVPGKNHTVREPITYLPIDPSKGYWQFKMDRITVNITSKNKTYPFCMNGCNTLVDTTTNNLVGPLEEINAINKLIGASDLPIFGRYPVKCDTVNKLPPINFVLAGKKFTLKGPNYIQQLTVNSVTVCVSTFLGSSAPSEQNVWILGGAFLSHFYSIYDMNQKQIGFVRAA